MHSAAAAVVTYARSGDPKMAKWHSKEVRARAVKMVVEDGVSQVDTSRKLGVPFQIVGYWVKVSKKSNAAPGRGPYKDAAPPVDPTSTRGRALLLIEQGLSQGEVARRLRVHQTTVSAWARKAGAGPGRPNEAARIVLKHTPDFKRSILERAKLEGQAKTAAALGLHKSTLQRWKAEADRAVRLARRAGLDVEKKPPPAPGPEPQTLASHHVSEQAVEVRSRLQELEGKTAPMNHTDSIARVKATLKAQIDEMDGRLAVLRSETTTIETLLPMLRASLAALEGRGGLELEVPHVDPVPEDGA